MPFTGSADVGGDHRDAAADACLEQYVSVTDAGVANDTQELRVVGLPRITAAVNQQAGVPASFEIWFRERDTATPRLWGTVLIGAVLVPESVTIHLVARTVFVRLPIGSTLTNYAITLFASGQS